MPVCLRDSWKVGAVVTLLLAVACGGADGGQSSTRAPTALDEVVFRTAASVATPVAAAASPEPAPVPAAVDPEESLQEADPEPAPTVPQPALEPSAAPTQRPPVIWVPATEYVPATPTPAPAPPGQAPRLSDALIGLINEARAENGLPPLAVNPSLEAMAAGYAEFHFENTDPFQLSHTLDGVPADRARREGYQGGVGEVLAVGAPSPEAFVQLWLNSPPHRDIILGAGYREMGVGCFAGPYTTDTGTTMTVALCVGDLGSP